MVQKVRMAETFMVKNCYPGKLGKDILDISHSLKLYPRFFVQGGHETTYVVKKSVNIVRIKICCTNLLKVKKSENCYIAKIGVNLGKTGQKYQK